MFKQNIITLFNHCVQWTDVKYIEIPFKIQQVLSDGPTEDVAVVSGRTVEVNKDI